MSGVLVGLLLCMAVVGGDAVGPGGLRAAPGAVLSCGRASPHVDRAVPASSAVRPAADRWFAEDKARHLFLSLSAVGFGYGAARTAGVAPGGAVVLAGAGALGAGLWKEWRDVCGGDGFSMKDLAWDGLGLLLGVALARRTR